MKPKAATRPSAAMEDVMTKTENQKKGEASQIQMVPLLRRKVEAAATNVSGISAMTVAVATMVMATTIPSVVDVIVSAIFFHAISQPEQSVPTPTTLALVILRMEVEEAIFRH